MLIEMLGIPLGIYSALRQYTFWDSALTTAALIVWGIPVFVLGLFMQWFFGLKLDLLATGRRRRERALGLPLHRATASPR